jgi:ketosteroid isomerase-like protein
MSEISDDHATIIALTQSETAAFLARDFPRWADHWLHDPAIRRLASFMGGMMDWEEGWEEGEKGKEALLKAFPNIYNTDLSGYRFENYSLRISGNMAWVSYDQYGPRSDDPLVTAGLSYQIRIFERHDGQWKIVMAGHGDTINEYFDFPAVRVDESAKILWMNDAAQGELRNHPVLIKSGAHLRCHHREDDKSMRAALIACAAMNVIGDIR